MSKLHELLKEKNLSIPQFAGLIGVHKTTAWGWLRGDYSPSVKAAKRILRWANGALKLEDIYNLRDTPNS